MGMDQYIIAKDKSNGYEFPLGYFRKNYELNQLICDYHKLDQSSCCVETVIDSYLVDHILDETSNPKTIDFFEYLQSHMGREGNYDMAKVPNWIPDYTYIYRADW